MLNLIYCPAVLVIQQYHFHDTAGVSDVYAMCSLRSFVKQAGYQIPDNLETFPTLLDQPVIIWQEYDHDDKKYEH